MPDDLFAKKAEFVSWSIEEYAAANNLSSRDVANNFSKKGVLGFLEEHYEILHTQGKNYILDAINDFIRTGDSK